VLFLFLAHLNLQDRKAHLELLYVSNDLPANNISLTKLSPNQALNIPIHLLLSLVSEGGVVHDLIRHPRLKIVN
jgi:hypothetical protein